MRPVSIRCFLSGSSAAAIHSGGKLLKLDVETQSLDDIYAHYFQEVEHGS